MCNIFVIYVEQKKKQFLLYMYFDSISSVRAL